MDYLKEAAYELRMPITHLCRKLGVSSRIMAEWRKNHTFPPKVCVKIERWTEGKVTRQNLRPNDYAEIWPELEV